MKVKRSSAPNGTASTVNVPIKTETYELIERFSKKLGIEPDLWINQVLNSKVKGKEAAFHSKK
jgi:hypothetical protein